MKIKKNERKGYGRDLTDSQWVVIAPLFPHPGNKSKWEKRELVNAILYLVKNGCKWRRLPHGFPPHTTVSNLHYASIRNGLWEKIRASLVVNIRIDARHKVRPSYGIIDSQSVKTTGAAEDLGNDGEKNERTKAAHSSRHHGKSIVKVHAANIHDTKSGILAAKLAFERYGSISRFCADAGYRRSFVQDVLEQLGVGVDISERIKPD